jgi:hypothetical protein
MYIFLGLPVEKNRQALEAYLPGAQLAGIPEVRPRSSGCAAKLRS